MFCPRCGQQQVSEEIKFCSRCGLPLGLTAEIVARGGELPANLARNCQTSWLTRGNAIKLSLAWFLVATFLLTPLAAVMNLKFFVPMFALFGFIGGILMMVLSLMFLPKEEKRYYATTGAVNDFQAPAAVTGVRSGAGAALPPQTSVPADVYAPPQAGSWKAPDTGELVPHSITEGTTKLLQQDEK